MAIILKNAGMFVHIPKCGGQFITKYLRETGLAVRETGAGTHDVIKWPDWVSYRKFCFVRHPITWYESWWKYNAGEWRIWEPGNPNHPQREIEDCADDDFNAFVEKVYKKVPGYVTQMYRRYTRACEFVGHQETMEHDLAWILCSLGHRVAQSDLEARPKVNISKARCGEPVWDPDLKAQVEITEADGIREFKYHSRSALVVHSA